MSPKSLALWRERLGLNKAEACRALGLARNTLDAYETGRNPIPLYIALACAAVAYGLPPMR